MDSRVRDSADSLASIFNRSTITMNWGGKSSAEISIDTYGLVANNNASKARRFQTMECIFGVHSPIVLSVCDRFFKGDLKPCARGQGLHKPENSVRVCWYNLNTTIAGRPYPQFLSKAVQDMARSHWLRQLLLDTLGRNRRSAGWL